MDEGTNEPVPVGAVLPTFASSKSPWPATKADLRVADVALDWQKLAMYATAAEMHGVLKGQPHGALTELIGRAAAAGEQLGLALTALRDARAWAAEEPGIARQLATRSMAEMSGYYSVSAGHGLANVTVRVLHVHSAAAFVLDRDFKRAAGFAPFVDDFGSWVSLNSEAAKSMVRAAEATKVPVAITMAGLLIQLLNDPRWSALHNRRNQDFHRWRGQSLIGGVPPRSPWKPLADGSSVLTVRAVPEHVPLEVTELVEEAAAGLYTLADSMHHWEVGLADSLRELGVPVWKSERHSP